MLTWNRGRKQRIQNLEEFEELALTLSARDFSRESKKDVVFQRVSKNMNAAQTEHSINSAKKAKRPIRAAAILAVVGVLGFAVMGSSFAKDLVPTIIKSVSLGMITFHQVEPSQKEPSQEKNDPNLKISSKQFDQEGRSVDSSTSGTLLELKDPDELKSYLSFPVLLPSYLPDGYQFNRYELYKGEDGTVSPKYVNIYFTNEKTGKFIFMQQRLADEETAFIASTTNDIKEVKINGVDAVISGGRNIDWESNHVLYGLSGRGAFDEKELIKIAKSVK